MCPVKIMPEDAAVKRAGASAIYLDGTVLLCGGRSGRETFTNCLSYDLESEEWSEHSTLLRPRDESAVTKIGSQVLLIGGLWESSVEVWDPTDRQWKLGSELPYTVGRGCAVSLDNSIMLTGGHDNSSTASLSTVLKLSAETGGWEQVPSMLEARRDHGCLYVEMERARGILVTGGLGTNDQERKLMSCKVACQALSQ